jgi:hypothetical protein
MFEYFYNEAIRKTVIIFGNLFKNIEIRQTNENNEVFFSGTVPIAYGPTQEFLARLREVPNLNKPVEITLPRMSFEIVGISYDSQRKLPTTTSFCSKAVDVSGLRKTYMPAPYNLSFELSIMTKHNDDILQIVEQILPYFQPNLKVSATVLDSIAEKRDLDIVLDNISMIDTYEGDLKDRRALIWTLKFTVKTFLFGPVSSQSLDSQIIKSVSIGLVSGDVSNSPDRNSSIESIPRALKNYTGIVETNLTKEISKVDEEIEVQNANNLIVNSYIDINGEEMLIIYKTDNKLRVKRGMDNTEAKIHVLGSEVKKITTSDGELIEYGDDFGFSYSIN